MTFEVIEGKAPKLSEVFEHYVDPATLQFDETRTTVKLGGFGRTLVSRSEARRIVAGPSKFAHATIDFSAVDVVRQGFCNEVFRVFATSRPGVHLEPVGMNEAIAFMVARAQRSRAAH